MPSSSRSDRSAGFGTLLDLTLVTALTVAARLPFLLRADRFFDSDEAVEGLMARHVLHGEFPAFLWGQHYKGVPEVYVAAIIFRLAGSSVVALKAATLALFTLFVALQFILVSRMLSRRVAWTTVLFTLAAPPAFVFWSLSPNAEIVTTLIAGAVAGLAIVVWKRWPIAAAAVGAGLWIQQYIVYYVVAAGVTWMVETPERWRGMWVAFLADDRPRGWRIVLRILAAGAVVYIGLGLAAFASGGFGVPFGNVEVGLRHPQKLWRIAAGLGLAWATVRWAGWWIAALLAGMAPAIVSRVAGIVSHSAAGGGAPVGRMDVFGTARVVRAMARDLVPIVFGFHTPTTAPLTLSQWLLLLPLAAIAFGVGRRWQKRPPAPAPTFFGVFLFTVPVVFLASGAYVDAQSYRYLMPVYAALPVVYALGIDRLWRWKPLAGGALGSALAVLFVAQQVLWYQRLTPDVESAAVIRCLDQQGIRVAVADYWLSYKVTFLTAERIVVAPINGVDRYPPFTMAAHASAAPMVRACPDGSGGSGTMTCCP